MNRRTDSQELETRRSVIVLASSAIFAASAVAAMPWLRKPARDIKTACLAGPLARKTIILVDRTDAWSPSTANLLTAAMQLIAERAAMEERLQVTAFDGSAATLPVPVFDRCKPPSSGNMIIETPQRIARFHAEQFAAPLAASLDALAKPSTAPRTELVQIIATIAARSRLEAPAVVTTLHVFSDMEENSAAFSFTKKPTQSLDLFASHVSATIGERLKDIPMHVHVIPPAGAASRADPRIERAWRAALTRQSITFTWEPL